MSTMEPCGSFYVTDTVVGGVADCSFAKGHGKLMNASRMNRTEFEHGNQRYGIWWNEDSSFHRSADEVKGCTAHAPDKTVYCGFDEGHPPVLGPVPHKSGMQTFFSHGNKKYDAWWNDSDKPVVVADDWAHNVNARVEMDSKSVRTYDIEGGRTFTTAPVSMLKVEQIEDPPQPDMVNHPPHYQKGGFEVIDILEAFFPTEPLLWQVGKYIMRSGEKGNRLQDLKKAQWYLEREIARTVADPELMG